MKRSIGSREICTCHIIRGLKSFPALKENPITEIQGLEVCDGGEFPGRDWGDLLSVGIKCAPAG